MALDWSNKEVINSPDLSYTSRDYNSIYRDLIRAIPNLTKLWDPQEETDPGIVLIKLMAMVGDMLSLTLDHSALENYPQFVLQTKNAQQIFRLIGYKMRWFQSARVAAYFTNSNSVDISIGRYNKFITSTGITYTNTHQLEIPAGAGGNARYKTELIQGRPITPTISGVRVDRYTGEWHDEYEFNIDVKKKVINGRIYLDDKNVDGSTVFLIDDDETSFATTEWRQVNNLNTVTEIGKIFEFDFDDTGTPFIQLPSYWNTRYVITRFKLFYIISDGEEGEIIDNALTSISPERVRILGSNTVSTYLNNLHIYNTASTYGFSPETPQEARRNAELYQNTIDTLVVLEDFTKAAKRITGIANAVATDKQTDPDGENMLSDTVKIYFIRKPGYDTIFTQDVYSGTDFTIDKQSINDDLWKQEIIDELQSYKLARYTIQPELENAINWIDWSIEGSIWLRQPVTTDKNHDIHVKINSNLDFTFSPSKLDFNEAINYIDVIDLIKFSDKLIYHVDLTTAAIVYTKLKRDNRGNPTGMKIVRKWMIYDNTTNSYTYYYANGFGCMPIPGGTGLGANAGYRIFREDGATWAIGILNDTGYDVNEFEIYNNRIFNWVQETRIDTDYYINDSDPDHPVIMKDNGSDPDTSTPYFFVERLSWYLSDGKESGIYLKRNKRNVETGNSIPSIHNGNPVVVFNYGVISDGLPEIVSTSFTVLKVGDTCANLMNGLFYTWDGVKWEETGELPDEIDSLIAMDRMVPSSPEISYTALLSKIDESDKHHCAFEVCPHKDNRELHWEIISYIPVYDIWSDEYNQWEGRFINRETGEIFVVRSGRVYSTNRSYDETTGDIVDHYGAPIIDANGNYIRDIVAKEELTGRYEQLIDICEDLTYDFYLGQKVDGTPLEDSVGNIIVGFPIKPDGLHIIIDTDKYVIHDNGNGILMGSPGILDGYGSINYSTGHVRFKTMFTPMTPLKVIYYKNVISMARYQPLNPVMFYTQPQFLRIPDANRSLG